MTYYPCCKRRFLLNFNVPNLQYWYNIGGEGYKIIFLNDIPLNLEGYPII